MVVGIAAAVAVVVSVGWLLFLKDDTSKHNTQATIIPSSPTSTPLTTQSLDEWITFVDPEGHFIAQLPDKPIRDLSTVDLPNGQSAQFTQYLVQLNRSEAIYISIFTLQDGGTFDLDRGIDALPAKDKDGIIVSRTTGVDAGGHRTLDVTMTRLYNEQRLHFIDAGDRVYVLQSVAVGTDNRFVRLVAGFALN